MEEQSAAKTRVEQDTPVDWRERGMCIVRGMR